MALTKVTNRTFDSGAVNVLQYNADPTGVADSTAAIQAAINAVGSNGAIYIPDGTYKITDTITIAQGTSVSIYGQSRTGTILQSGLSANDASKYMFHYQGDDAVTANLCQNVTISTLTLNALYFGRGIYAEHCFPNLVVDQVLVFKPFQYGIFLEDCWGASLYDCEVDGDNYTDIYGYRIVNANNVCMYNCRVYNMDNDEQSTGIGATSCENFSIFGGNVENCPRGIYLTLGGTFDGPATIRDVYFEPRAMQPFDSGQPNDHIKVLGDSSDNGSVLIEGCLFQAGTASVPIAYNGVSAQNIGTVTLIGNVWQKARYTVGGSGENYFIDVDTTVGKVIELGNTLISTSLGTIRQMPVEVVHEYSNTMDTGTNEPGNNLSKFSAITDTTKTNVTGDGTAYTIIYDAELYDIGNDYNAATGVFTARRNGYYQFDASVRLENITGGATDAEFYIVTTDGTYMLYAGALDKDSGNKFSMSGSITTYMEATDTAYVAVKTSGGTKTDDITDASAVPRVCHFSGTQI